MINFSHAPFSLLTSFLLSTSILHTLAYSTLLHQHQFWFNFSLCLSCVLLSQVQAFSEDDYTKIPQWSEPIVHNLIHLPAPELATADLVSTSLEAQDSGHVITATVSANWESPPDHEDLAGLEAWVGSRSVAEFEEPDLIQESDGTVVTFEVRVAKHILCCV